MMGYDASAPPCPRCGTPFPTKARFCRSCGLTQEVAHDPIWRASAALPASDYQQQGNLYAAQAPSAAPPDDPFARARRGQAYQGYQAGYADYDDAPPPKRPFWRSLWGLTVIAFLLLLVVGASAFAIYYYPSLCSVQQRKSLRQDIPLPCGITYLNHLDRSASGTTGPGSEEWVYSVDDQTPAQIIAFYQQRLPTSDYGWKLPAAVQDVESHALAACKGETVALIRGTDQTAQEDPFTFEPPPGGSLLLIILAPRKNLAPQIQQACALSQG